MRRYYPNRPVSQEVTLYDPDTDTELDITAWFYRRPAEPDNGIQGDYIEWDYATVKTPMGEIYIDLDDWHLERTMENLNDY